MGRSSTTRRGPLPAPVVHANDETLTRYAGMVPAIRFLSGELQLPREFREVVGATGRRRRHPVHKVLFAFLVGALAGVQRLAHLEWLRGDAVMLKFLRLGSWPCRKVFSKALAGMSDAALERLRQLVTRVGLRSVTRDTPVVLDFDGSSIVSFGHHEGARFGYSGKGRNRRRHYPLVASVAESRAVVNALYRDGRGTPHAEVIDFFGDTMARVRDVMGEDTDFVVRADSGFWSNPTGAWLLEQGVPFVFSKPLTASVKLMLHGASWRALELEPDIHVAVLPGEDLKLDKRLRIVAIRRRVTDPKAPPQGKRIEGDANWRYQALITERVDWAPEDVWRFYNGRADCERVFRVARQALGMGWLIGKSLRANAVAFLLRLLAFNADLLFQRRCERRAAEDKRPVKRQGLEARQHYFYLAPGRWLRRHNRWVMRVEMKPAVLALWEHYAPELISSA